jgi:DNA-binding NarL/FixJ family response regulator
MLLRVVLEDDPRVDVVGEAGDGLTGVEEIARLQPDVALLDLAMPGMDGLEAIPLIHERSPTTRIAVFSGYSGDQMRAIVLRLKASVYIEKGAPLDEVLRAVRELGGLVRDGTARDAQEDRT